MRSNNENLRDWLTRRQSISYVWPAYFMRARQTLQHSTDHEIRPDDEKHQETAIEDIADLKSLHSKEVDIAAIIMMPKSRQTLHSPTDLVYEIDETTLYYELGIAHTIVQDSNVLLR